MSSQPESISESNKSPLVQLLTSLFLAIAVLALLVRLGTKYSRAGKLAIEDGLASIATLFAIGQSLAVIFQCKNGLGKHQASLSSEQITRQMKSQYAAAALFILSSTSAQLSYLASVRTLSNKLFQKISIVIGSVISLWSVPAFFVVLFQCRAPQTWDFRQDSCINTHSFWTFFSAMDFISEVTLISLLIIVVAKIKTSVVKRAFVVCVFGNRIVLLPALVAQLVLRNETWSLSDVTFPVWKSAVANQVVQCLAITTICIPYLKPFLDSLESGQMRVDGTRQAQTHASSYARAASRQTGQSKKAVELKSAGFIFQDASSQGSSTPTMA